MQVTASFAETDLASLKAGQDAAVSIAATADTVDGTVTAIDPVASNTGTSSVVTYSVTMTLKDVPDLVKTGMSADVSVTTALATGVIADPKHRLGRRRRHVHCPRRRWRGRADGSRRRGRADDLIARRGHQRTGRR